MMDDALERQQKSLSTVSHDLKSPMVAIIGCARFLARDMKNKPHDPKWLEMVDRMAQAGDGMLELIESILSMVKMEAGNEKLEPEIVEDLNAELRGTVATFEYEANAKGIGLFIELPDALPAPVWDMTRLRYHVFNNILSNALKFTPAGGKVSLSATALEKCLLIRISDTGPGIPPHDREKIFCRFEQGSMRSKRVYRGSGLGLYNARLFVTQHGGNISIERSSESGTVFLIELPLVCGGTRQRGSLAK